jgi:pimeloyl-[acyl-carrier protein] synthase
MSPLGYRSWRLPADGLILLVDDGGGGWSTALRGRSNRQYHITLIGGHETTTNRIASGFLTLLRHPDSLEQLQSRPKIVLSAVEELLRYESPAQHTARIASADMELGGKSIQKGAKVVAALAAANRDPKRSADPDRLDLFRSDNRHLAFGLAAHFCFGAPLARMEGQIAFNTLLRGLKNPVLLEGKLQWRENAGLRDLTKMRIAFDLHL